MNTKMYAYILLSIIGFSAGNLIADEDLDQKEVHTECIEKTVEVDVQPMEACDVLAKYDKEAKECLQSIEVSYKRLEDGMDMIRQVEACQETLTELSIAIVDAESMEEIEELRQRVEQVRATMEELERKANRWNE